MSQQSRSWRESLKSALLDSWSGETTGRARWFFFVVFYVVIANIPYWVASREFGFLSGRGVFCLQFVTVGLVALVVRPVFSAVLLLAVMAADIVNSVHETYWLSIRQCLSNMRAFEAFSSPRRVAATAVVLLALILAAIALILRAATVRRADRGRAAACLFAFAVLFLSMDTLTIIRQTGHFPTLLRATAARDGIDTDGFDPPRLARISILRLIRANDTVGVIGAEAKGKESPTPVPSAAAVALRSVNFAPRKRNQELPNVVTILVESWGIAGNAALREALIRPYMQPGVLARYEVVQGVVPFHGPTIPGEARELCGNSFGYYVMVATPEDFKGCLPAHFDSLGYRSIALHGMDGDMFHRSSWYRTIGFEERWFHDQFKEQGLPDCNGALVGTCDADVAQWIGRRLAQDAPYPFFVHWMTLNSHLPVLVPSTLPAGAACSPDLSLAPKTPLCSWYQLVANVHQSVSELAMGKLSRPTVFVIVGDHAPPFSDPAVRDRFSQTDVPFVLLLPRPDNSTKNRILARNSLAAPGKVARPSIQTP